MTRINLLPHREAKKKRLQIQIAVLAGIVAVVGLVVVGLVGGAVRVQIEYQAGRNAFLQKEITALEKQLDEIKKLKEQIQAMKSRQKVVETLRLNRSEVVRLLDELSRQMPEGVYFKSLKQTGSKINFTGYAQSNARVSTLMRSLDASPWLESPQLVEVRAVTVNNARLNEFTLNMTLTRQAAETADTKKAAAQPASAKPAEPAPKK